MDSQWIRRRFGFAIVAVIATSLLVNATGCAGVANREAMVDAVAPGVVASPPVFGLEAAASEGSRPIAFSDDGEESEAAPTEGRLRIYTADLSVRVVDPKATCDAFQAFSEELGGYLVERSQMSITVRLPAKSFDRAVEQCRAYGQVADEYIEVMDVTRAVRELEIRIDNARRSRDRLLAILEQADDVESVLKIESELRRLTEEIEEMEAEMRDYRERIAYSTITLDLDPLSPSSSVRPPRRSRFDWINEVGIRPLLEWF